MRWQAQQQVPRGHSRHSETRRSGCDRAGMHVRSSAHYADIGITAIMPRAGLCRMAVQKVRFLRSNHASVRHNQRASATWTIETRAVSRVGAFYLPGKFVNEKANAYRSGSMGSYSTPC
jgi:hypothetical protein